MPRAFSSLARAATLTPARRGGAGVAPLQRAPAAGDHADAHHATCACGGGCPKCAVQRTPVEGVIQRDFERHPEHSDEEVFAAMENAETEEQPMPEEEDMGGDMGGMQMKLIVGSQDDPSEREADDAADAVVSGGSPPRLSAARGGPSIDRAAVQDSGVRPPADMAKYVEDPGAGSALPPFTRAVAERGLGSDFSHVRVHTDDRAQAAAASVGARAFTMGSSVWLGRGESPHDTRLMAHELAHVVQQEGACEQPGGAAPVQRKIITSPAKLVSFIEGTPHKTEKRTDPVSGTTGPAKTNLLVHEDWHLNKHPDPADPAGKDINGSFGGLFMDFHHAMMDGFKAAGGVANTWGPTTQPPTGEDFSRFSDPAKLAKIKTANNFGNLIVGPHNGSHGFFGGADPEDAGMNDFYWAPRHDVFYKLHMWMDDRYMDWKALQAPKKSTP